MKKIHAFWWRLDKGNGNFGDELNPYIINKLSLMDVKHVSLPKMRDSFILTLIAVLRKIKYKKYKIKYLLKYEEWSYIFNKPSIIIGIGSIISVYNYKHTIVWGAGIIKKKANINPATFKAVRGKHTQKRMKELNLKAPDVIGDPALLLPIVYNPKVKKKYKLAIIPHYKHYESLKKSNKNSDLLIINLLDEIETIIKQIKACELTISTSLHGIIVSHAYNIPSLWVTFNEAQTYIGGDDVKFRDYFSSVELPEYKVWNGGKLSNWKTTNLIEEIKLKPQAHFLPDPKVLKKIQNNLIRVAPFPLHSKYCT